MYAHIDISDLEKDELIDIYKFMIENSDSFTAVYPDKNLKGEDDVYNAFDILIDDSTRKIGEDNTGFGTWEVWTGDFSTKKKKELINYLTKKPIYNITLFKNNEKLYQINDFINIYAHSKAALDELNENFKNLDCFIFEK